MVQKGRTTMLQQKLDYLQKSIQISFNETVDKTIQKAINASVNKSLDFIYSKAFYLITNKISLSLSFDGYYLSEEDLNSVYLVVEKLSPEKFREHAFRSSKNINRKCLTAGITYFINLHKINSYIIIKTLPTNIVANNVPSDRIRIYFFGKQKKRAYHMFLNTLKKYGSPNIVQLNPSPSKRTLTIVNNDDGVFDISYANIKNETQLCYEGFILEETLNYLTSWNKATDIFKNLGLTYKIGILLYGVPGTGKTSFAKLIAYHFDFKLLILDLKTFTQHTIRQIKSYIHSHNRQTIVLLMEDIDCIFPKRSELKTPEEKAAAQLLLQFLDGSASIGNIIYIATTNHIEALDPALIRDGRFDIKHELKPFQKETAIEMCKSMYVSDPETINTLLKDEQFPINPAYLQNKILKYIFNHLEEFNELNIKEEEEKENGAIKSKIQEIYEKDKTRSTGIPGVFSISPVDTEWTTF